MVSIEPSTVPQSARASLLHTTGTQQRVRSMTTTTQRASTNACGHIIAQSTFLTQPDRIQLDISKLQATDVAPLHAQLWLSSPSCQPYTVLNPNAQGEADPRAASFLHLISVVLPALATTQDHPEYILIENVAGFEVRTHIISTSPVLPAVSAVSAGPARAPVGQ